MYLTTRQAADELGVSPNSVKKLISAGVLPTVWSRGVRATLPLPDVQALAARPWLRPSGLGVLELPVLRVDAAEPVDEPDRKWKGYGASLDVTELLDALRGWWKGDPDRISAAGFVPVTVSGFVVAVLSDVKAADARRFAADTGATVLRHRFSCQLSGRVTDLVAPHCVIAPRQAGPVAARTRRLLGNRIASLSGGPIAYVVEADATVTGTGV